MGDLPSLGEARSYLHQNVSLRTALGISPDKTLELVALGAGEHNLNYLFSDPATQERYVLRINVVPQPFHECQVLYEYEALRCLEPSGCTPRVLYVDDSREFIDKDALVISYCQGQELDFDALRPGDLRCALQLMADVHAVTVDDDCGLYRPADPLRALYDECVQRYRAYQSSGFEKESISRWTESFMTQAAQCLDGANAKDAGHIINSETLPSHFLIPKESADRAAAAGGNGRFCTSPGSFIDWERPLVGEVAQDVAYFVSPTTTFWDSKFFMDQDQAYELVEGYWQAVDSRFDRMDFDARFQAWRMMTALRSTTWCCKAFAQLEAGTAAYISAKAREKLPLYLSDEFMERISKECFNL